MENINIWGKHNVINTYKRPILAIEVPCIRYGELNTRAESLGPKALFLYRKGDNLIPEKLVYYLLCNLGLVELFSQFTATNLDILSDPSGRIHNTQSSFAMLILFSCLLFVLTLSLLTVPSPNLINFPKLQPGYRLKNRHHKVLFNSFPMNGHTLGFYP